MAVEMSTATTEQGDNVTIGMNGGDIRYALERGGEEFPYAYNNASYYLHNNNDSFYSLAPDYYLPYYQNILKPQMRIYDGYLKGFHDIKQGLVPRKLLQRLTEKITNITIPNSIDYSADNDLSYGFISKWCKKIDFYRKLKQAYRYAVAGGSSLIAINYTPNTKERFNLSSYRIDQFFVDVDSYGKVTKAKIWVDEYKSTTPTADGNKSLYALFEERYYDNGIPYSIYKVYVKHGLINNQEKSLNVQAVNADRLPKDVLKWVRDNYGAVLLSTPIRIKSETLDCWLLHSTDLHPVYTGLPFGEPIGSMLFNESMTYDILGMTNNVELYLGKGRVLLPNNMVDPNGGKGGGRMKGIEYQYYDSGSLDDVKPVDIQFDIRSQDLKGMRDLLLEDIATSTSYSPTTIAQFLASASHTSSRTILEIETSNQATNDTTETRRALIKQTIDELLTSISRRFGCGKVEILFNKSQSATFETKAAIYMQMWQTGIISAEDFVNDMFSQLSYEQKQQRINYMNSQKQLQIQQQQLAQQQIKGDKNDEHF